MRLKRVKVYLIKVKECSGNDGVGSAEYQLKTVVNRLAEPASSKSDNDKATKYNIDSSFPSF